MKIVFGKDNTNVRKPLPKGVYQGKIVKSEWQKNAIYKDEANPEGWSLLLWIDVFNKNHRLFSNIPITKAVKLNKLRESANLKQVGEDEDFVADDLLGKTINFELDVYKTNSNKMINIIVKFIKQEHEESLQEENEGDDENLEEENEEEYPF